MVNAVCAGKLCWWEGLGRLMTSFPPRAALFHPILRPPTFSSHFALAQKKESHETIPTSPPLSPVPRTNC